MGPLSPPPEHSTLWHDFCPPHEEQVSVPSAHILLSDGAFLLQMYFVTGTDTPVGFDVGVNEGTFVGEPVGALDGLDVGAVVGAAVPATIQNSHPHRQMALFDSLPLAPSQLVTQTSYLSDAGSTSQNLLGFVISPELIPAHPLEHMYDSPDVPSPPYWAMHLSMHSPYAQATDGEGCGVGDVVGANVAARQSKLRT